MSGTTPSSSILGRFERQLRLSDRVAADILGTIVERRLQPGDPLPPERELGEQFGVSRTVIREAVRALEARGLLEVRVGSRIKVAAVAPSAVTDAVWHFIRTHPGDLSAIGALSDALHAAAARVAADRATSDDLQRIRAAAMRIDRGEQDVADQRFRRAVLAASHSDLLAALADAIAGLAAPARPPAATGSERHLAVEAAIARHDPAAAELAMREWLGEPAASDTGPG